MHWSSSLDRICFLEYLARSRKSTGKVESSYVMLWQITKITEYLWHLWKVIYKGTGSGPPFFSIPNLRQSLPGLVVRCDQYLPWWNEKPGWVNFNPESLKVFKRRAWSNRCRAKEYSILHIYITSYHLICSSIGWKYVAWKRAMPKLYYIKCIMRWGLGYLVSRCYGV